MMDRLEELEFKLGELMKDFAKEKAVADQRHANMVNIQKHVEDLHNHIQAAKRGTIVARENAARNTTYKPKLIDFRNSRTPTPDFRNRPAATPTYPLSSGALDSDCLSDRDIDDEMNFGNHGREPIVVPHREKLDSTASIDPIVTPLEDNEPLLDPPAADLNPAVVDPTPIVTPEPQDNPPAPGPTSDMEKQ